MFTVSGMTRSPVSIAKEGDRGTCGHSGICILGSGAWHRAAV
ncbi:hypothetical protein L810_1604 [Burkholderia sp. AU4i]|nr:hypothetical protein L810_1604 [Burkholderia sp. AU4i]